MRKLNLRLLLIVTLGVATPLNAKEFDKIYTVFSRCNADFFAALKQNETLARTLAPTSTKGNALWFVVPNRNKTDESTVQFSKPVDVAGFAVVGYVDDRIDLLSLGVYYSWGFKVKGEVAEVASTLKALTHDGDRLRKDGDVFVRTELQDQGSTEWKKTNTAGGAVPKKGTVERVFLIEQDEQDKGLVRVSCSIQGSVEARHVKELRPDIDEVTPAKRADTSVPTYENAVVANALIQKTLAAYKQDDRFLPKFKQLSFSYKVDKSEWHTTLENNAGVVESVEDVPPVASFQRQYVGNLVQVKYSATVLGLKSLGALAHDATLTTNAQAKTGEVVLSLELVNDEYLDPINPTKLLRSKRSVSCESGDTIEAKEIHASLTGQALRLKCTYKNQKSSEVLNQALILEFGWVVGYEPPESTSKYKPIYSKFSIVR